MRHRSGVLAAALLWRGIALGQEPVAAPRAELARVETVGHKGQSRAPKDPWSPVAAGAGVGADDGLRTLERSSLAARLDGGARLLLSEATTVTLQGPGAVALAAGQLDVEVPVGGVPVGVEAGGARITVGAAEAPAWVRVRLRGAAAQAMVLSGTARFTVAAGSGDLTAGTGATLAGASPVLEKLLPAPVTSAPAPGSSPDHANPRFWWEDVPGAAGYTVEVCHDEACGDLEDRAAAVVGAPWAPEGLPLGELYWRVVAISPTGLDGVPSRAVRFTVRSLWRKPHPRPR